MPISVSSTNPEISAEHDSVTTLSVPDIAKLTHRRKITVLRWIHRKHNPLKAYRPGGTGMYVVYKADWEMFLSQTEVSAEPDFETTEKMRRHGRKARA